MENREFEEAVKMIDRIYRELYKSDEVRHRVKDNLAKFDNIKSYINRLERIHEKAKHNQNFISMLKKYYYNKYVIKPEDIPDSYYEHQQKLAFERGYGTIEITNVMKKKYQEQIINDQKRSLDIWLDYFFSDDSNYIPMWAKFWSFQGMLRLGTFDKKTGKFNQRSKKNIGLFADLNREALAKSIDYVKKILNKENIEDQDLENLIKSGSFAKIYEYLLNNLSNNQEKDFNSDQGIWIKYERNSSCMQLVSSLQGYNTGWCTAGIYTASSQLRDGDFYVYYTKDKNDEYKVPRIAIRMEGNFIGEIRGVAPGQNIESSMEKVLAEKIKDFPDREKYYKRIHDMEHLTYIYEQNKNGGELSIDNLRFLYEIDERIDGFGYGVDPRIKEIKNSRNMKKDISIIFNCNEDEVAIGNMMWVNPYKVVCLYGSLECNTYEVDYPNLKYITFSASCDCLRSARGLQNLQYIGRYADFRALESARGLENLRYIGKYAHFDSLKSAWELRNLQYMGMGGNFTSLISIAGLENVKYCKNSYGILINKQLSEKLKETNKMK